MKRQKETHVSTLAHPRTWIISAIAVAGIGASTAFVLGTSPDSEPEVEEAANPDALTKDQVVAFAGGPPERCVYALPDREICTWKLDGTLLAPGADPEKDGVNLVCELPIQAGSGFEGSCTPHARSAGADLPPVSAGGTPNGSPEAQAPGRVVSELDDAPTLPDLVRRLGDAPDVCRTGLQQQTCIWRVPEEAAARRFASAGALELRCTLPLDGSPRAAGSCIAAPLR